MPSIAVVTDSDSSLPRDLAARHGIRLVPITVHFGDEIYRTELDIDDAALFQRIDRDGVLPTTSAPAPGAFAEAYEDAFSAGAESVVCICVSSKVSATYSAAVAARDMLPGRDVHVLDSFTLSMPQGYMAIAAAEAAQAGASVPEVLAAASEVRDRTRLFAALATLKYLAMSGRVGHLAAGMGKLLNIKPILTIRDGELSLLERVRTQGKAWQRTIDLVADSIGAAQVEQMAVFHVAAREHAQRFEEMLQARIPCPNDVLIADLTAGLAVHSGAGMVGAAALIASS